MLKNRVGEALYPRILGTPWLLPQARATRVAGNDAMLILDATGRPDTKARKKKRRGIRS